MKRLFLLIFCSIIYTGVYSQTPKDITDFFYHLPLGSSKVEMLKIFKSDSNFVRIRSLTKDYSKPVNPTLVKLMGVDTNEINSQNDSIIKYRADIKNPYLVTFPPDSSKIEIDFAMNSEWDDGNNSEYKKTIIFTTTYFYSSKKNVMEEYKGMIKKTNFLGKKHGKLSGSFIEEGVSFLLNEGAFLPHFDIYLGAPSINGAYPLMLVYECYEK